MKYKKILQRNDKKFYWKEGDLHTNFGIIKEKDIKTKSKVTSNTKKEFSIYEAKFTDNLRKIRRGPQIMTPKDIGRIIIETGINKNSTVLDCGTGSGMLAASLANISKKVITYEKREGFAKIAKKNFEDLGLKNITIKNKDIYEGIEEKDLDLITLDLEKPQLVLKHAESSLTSGGFLVIYVPTIPQIQSVLNNLTINLQVTNFIEILERKWKFENGIIRPENQMLGHTGFLLFLRKV
ncbi:methyltransferase domain-containing protein [Candidatus Woesearchaeota archaeon]|jgi:tRNA (adenine57-N1/adenine58-N1)-methyltransferase catalytic subunit|nr:methyltransferase domain-containing protein [Candidatus Woesearchaeota archaeon]MBT4322160.1 methyltransferase domain-containing protein [Candidatus Woesearchaeota archaeon]MBT4630840.1 methyltransferase domain-containing protein [Candidatus Woesearchaeota archaeon]